MIINKKSNHKSIQKERTIMNKAIAVVLIIGATLVLIGLTIFSDSGTFGDAKTQRDRAHEISNTTTVPTTLP